MKKSIIFAASLALLIFSALAQDVPSPVKFDAVSAGVFVTCAISTEKELYCFGNNDDGAVGDGTKITRTAPTLVAGGGEWCKISGGDWHVSGTKCDGGGYSWGYNGGRLGIGKEDPVQAATPQKLEGSWIEVSAGHFHGCGIQSDGKAYCWGNNRNGRMGTGKVSEPGEYELNPQAVKSDDREWVSISAKGSHTCGLKEDNTAWCWGGNEDGEIGNGKAGKSEYVTTPYQIPGNWKQIQSGLRFSCAIDQGDDLYCWGALRGGGSPSAVEILGPKPVLIGTNLKWKSISGGMQHACGILTNDTARCFGLGWHGQLGNGEELATGTQSTCPSKSPCEPEGNYRWKDIAAGEYNTCGVLEDGDLVCFGENPYGQLGNGRVGGEFQYEPTRVLPALRSWNASIPAPGPAPGPTLGPAQAPGPSVQATPPTTAVVPQSTPDAATSATPASATPDSDTSGTPSPSSNESNQSGTQDVTDAPSNDAQALCMLWVSYILATVVGLSGVLAF